MTVLASRRVAPLVCAFLSGAVLSTAASAGAFGSITVSDFRIGLTDLNPNDGIDPSMAFVLPTEMLGNKVEAQAGALNAGTYNYGAAIGVQPLDPVSTKVVTPTAAVTASIGPGSVPGSTTTVKLAGWATPSTLFDDRSEFFARGVLPANSMVYGNLSLTPWSSITFSFDVDIVVGTTGGKKTNPNFGGEYSSAGMSFLAIANNSNQTRVVGHELVVNSSAGNGTYVGASDSGHWAANSVTLTNDTNEVMYAQVTLFTQVWGLTYADPVPEPATVLMMASGVLLLAGRRALRKSAGAAQAAS
nr:PEP-CTERM sorting domain-containing protein [uncultured Roseateles sp.]